MHSTNYAVYPSNFNYAYSNRNFAITVWSVHPYMYINSLPTTRCLRIRGKLTGRLGESLENSHKKYGKLLQSCWPMPTIPSGEFEEKEMSDTRSNNNKYSRGLRVHVAALEC